MTTEPHPAVALVLRAAGDARLRCRPGVDYVDVRLRPARARRPRRSSRRRSARRTSCRGSRARPSTASRSVRPRARPGLLAEIDDETGRATTLTARRDEL